MINMNQTPVCIFSRVSTNKQLNERQEYELGNYVRQKGYTCSYIISTTISGRKPQRPDLDELLQVAKKKIFQKVIVTEISRLGRTSKVIRRTIDQLHDLGISVIFKNIGIETLDENGNESFVTNIIIAVFAELSESEGNGIVDRIISGIELAKSKGVKLGRPKDSVENSIEKYPTLVRDIKSGLTLRQCMKIHGVSKNTVIKVKKEVLKNAA